MMFCICEPKKFEVVKRFSDVRDADKFAVAQLKKWPRWHRLACVMDHTGAKYLTERKPDREYRIVEPGKVQIVIHRNAEKV